MTNPDFVEQLLDPAAHPEPPGSIELRQTHISWLILTDRWVYKIKKPLDLGFLDFSDLDERHRFCHEEVRLNHRLSPDVYLGVVVLRRSGDRVIVGEIEEDSDASSDGAVDYAVKMRRLPADQWLIRRLEDGTAGAESIERVARRIAAFHSSVGPTTADCPTGRLETVRFNTEENFAQVTAFVGRTLTTEQFDVVRAYTRTYLGLREDLFRQREAEGRVLDGHGDLHAAQICLEDGISFIDCIEFNERFRIADVAADVAFLAMDLDRHGREDLRRVFVDTYVNETGDPGLREILPFYMAYRAFTRGKVASFRFDQLEADRSDESGEARATAEGYFSLAQSYASPSPVLIMTSGFMGSGKSTVAEATARRLGCSWVRTDGVRKELAGLAPDEPAQEAWGEGIYSPEFTRRTYDEVHRRAAEALSRGRCVILDGSYRKAHWREEARRVAENARVPFLAVEVVTPDQEVRSRLAGRSLGRSVSDGRLDLLDDQKRRFEPLAEIPPTERIEVQGSGPVDPVAYQVLEAVYRRSLGGDVTPVASPPGPGTPS
ncbi:MAG: AAA family ATPase [Longimicrobiales bacterium]